MIHQPFIIGNLILALAFFLLSSMGAVGVGVSRELVRGVGFGFTPQNVSMGHVVLNTRAGTEQLGFVFLGKLLICSCDIEVVAILVVFVTGASWLRLARGR